MAQPTINEQQLQLFIQVELAKEHFNLVLAERSKLWTQYFYDTFLSTLKNFLTHIQPKEEEEIKKFLINHIIPTLYVDFLTEKVCYIVQLKFAKNHTQQKENLPTQIFYQFPLTADDLIITTWESHKKHLNEKIEEFAENVKEVTKQIISDHSHKKPWFRRVISACISFKKKIFHIST